MLDKMSFDNKLKWKQSFQKTKSLSQSSMNASRKASLLEDETSDQELQEYLESLKKKSGIRRLWSGDKFEKAVRDDEDKTPDISISSSDNEEEVQSFHSDVKQDDYSDDDFKPNIVMLPDTLSDPKDNQSDVSSGELFHGVQLANFDFSEGETKEPKSISLNNEDLSKSVSISEPKDINAIMNNLHLASEIETEDEVAEEIEDDIDIHIDETIPPAVKIESPDYSSFQSSPEPNHTARESTTPSGRRSKNRPRSRAKSATSIEQSYTMDFSSADEPSMISEKTESFTQSSRRSRSSHRSRSSRSSRSSHRTKSNRSHSSISDQSSMSYDKPKSSHKSRMTTKVLRDKNSHVCDIGVQTGLDLDQGLHIPRVPPGLGVGMATGGQSVGMQYVDPSPIATHAVSAEALEAVTAYNPAVVALTDMLKQQIRLVQQFVDANNRMYQAYTSNINTQYCYTTLEDTMEFIEKNKPKTLTMKEALRQVKDEDT